MRYQTALILVTSGLSLLIAGCGAGSSLSTGSLMGGSSATQPTAEKPITPTDRALHVGATVARAQRCGFVFEPEQVRGNFLAAEQQAGTAPDALQKAQKEFDFTRQTILAAIAKDDAYCTEGRNREVKAALNRHLVGDFNPPRARAQVNVGLFEHQKRNDTFDGNKVFDTSDKKPGILGGGEE